MVRTGVHFCREYSIPAAFICRVSNWTHSKIHRILPPKSIGFQLKIRWIPTQSPMDLESKSDGFFPYVRWKESPPQEGKFSETAILAAKVQFSASYKRLQLTFTSWGLSPA